MREQQNVNAHRGGDGHLVVYLAWPLLAGLGMAIVTAVSVGGLVWVIAGWGWVTLWAAVVFFGVLGLGTTGVFLYAASQWAGPGRLAQIRQTVVIEELEPAEPEVRFIRVGGRPLALNTPAPALPSGVNRGIIGQAIAHLAGKLRERAKVHTLASEVQTLEPEAPAWVVEFYRVVCAAWPERSLSRRTFERLWPGGEGKRLWAKYVNGSGGRHSQRGLWDTWGVIAKTGPRGSWEWVVSLDVIFGLDGDLQAYATATAGLVHSPTTARAVAKTRSGHDQTRPDRSNQTRRRV